MIKQRRLTVTTSLQELVSEDPNRTSFLVQNIDDESIAGIYNRKEEPYGAIYLYPGCWLYFEKHDDADKQWWIKMDAGSGYIHVVQFYREAPVPKPSWWPY